MTRPSREELENEETAIREERSAALMYEQFCVLQHLDPDTSEAATRYEEWFQDNHDV